MYKKISVLVAMIALLGVVQHAECKKMFEKTRARVQEKYGAWKAGRQQKKEKKEMKSRVERHEALKKEALMGRLKPAPAAPTRQPSKLGYPSAYESAPPAYKPADYRGLYKASVPARAQGGVQKRERVGAERMQSPGSWKVGK